MLARYHTRGSRAVLQQPSVAAQQRLQLIYDGSQADVGLEIHQNQPEESRRRADDETPVWLPQLRLGPLPVLQRRWRLSDPHKGAYVCQLEANPLPLNNAPPHPPTGRQSSPLSFGGVRGQTKPLKMFKGPPLPPQRHPASPSGLIQHLKSN